MRSLFTPKMPILIDSHEDLAYNILTFGRDYRRSAAETRRLEVGQRVLEATGNSLLGWPEYQRGQVALVCGTIFVGPRRYLKHDWETQTYDDYAGARRLMRAQVDVYRRLAEESPDMFTLVRTRSELDAVLAPWDAAPANPPQVTHPTGLVILMESAEGLAEPEEVEEWWELGVRIIGPVWGGSRWCGGTVEPGPFRPEGFRLLDVMADLGFTLDISHMSDESAVQALEYYRGRVIASHANIRALIPGDSSPRQLTEPALRRLIERDGVMGFIPFNRFLKADFVNSDPRETVTLDHYLKHIDTLCQMAGNAHHAAIGTDFDGGFGWPWVPLELDTIADLQQIAPRLQSWGYSDADVAAILGGNWRRLLEETLPR